MCKPASTFPAHCLVANCLHSVLVTIAYMVAMHTRLTQQLSLRLYRSMSERYMHSMRVISSLDGAKRFSLYKRLLHHPNAF